MSIVDPYAVSDPSDGGPSLRDQVEQLRIRRLGGPGRRLNIPRPKETPYGMSVANVARQALGQGLALGFGDEVEGLIRGAYNAAMNGQPLSDAISQGIDYARKQNAATEAEYPGTSLGLQIAGGALTGLAGAGRSLAAKGLSMGERALRASVTGGAVGGVVGAGMSEGDPIDRLPDAAIGMGLGATVGAALPVAAAGIAKGGRALGRFWPGGAKRQAAGWMQNTFDEDAISPLTASDKLRGMGDVGVLADVGGPSVKDLARYSATQYGGKAAQKFLGDRNIAQGPRIAAAINRDLSDMPLDDFLESVGQSRRRAAQKGYGDLYEKPVELTADLKKFFENELIQDVYPYAAKLAAGEGKVLPKLFEVVDGVKIYATPTMRMLDVIKRSLDDDVSAAFRTGKGELGSVLKTLRDDFRDTVDELVPDYKSVRSVYAGHSAALESAELGSKFILTPKSVSVKAIEKMGDHEREAFITGVADALRYKVLSAPDAADAVKRIFGNHLARDRLKAAFGKNKDAFARFEMTMKHEAAMAETTGKVMFGSRTAPMMADEATFSGAAGAARDAVLAAQGSPGHVVGLLTRGVDALKAPPEAVSKHLSKWLLSPAGRAEGLSVLARGETPGRMISRFGRAPAAGVAGLLSGRKY